MIILEEFIISIETVDNFSPAPGIKSLKPVFLRWMSNSTLSLFSVDHLRCKTSDYVFLWKHTRTQTERKICHAKPAVIRPV